MDAELRKQTEFEELISNSHWQQRAPYRLERLLLYAVMNRDIDQIKALLAAGADIKHHISNYRGIGSTFLHCAIGRGYADSVATLLEACPNFNEVDEMDTPACRFAFLMGYQDIVELFPLEVIHRDVLSNLCYPPLSDFQLTNIINNETNNVDESNSENDKRYIWRLAEAISLSLNGTSLHHVIKFDININVLRLLLETSAADIDVVDHDDLTPLHWAIRRNNVSAATILLECGASISTQDPSGVSTLAMAVRKRCMPMIMLLTHTWNSQGYLLDGLHEAAVTGYAEAIPVLFAIRDLDVNFRPFGVSVSDASLGESTIGHTLLSMAVHYGNNDSMAALLGAGADPNCVVNEYNLSVMHLALRETIDINLLLDHAPHLDIIEQSTGGTALHRYARWNRLHSALSLMHAGANLNLKDKQGRTPAQVAELEGLTSFSRAIFEASYSLQHLCLLKIRDILPLDTTRDDIISSLSLPVLVKQLLCQLLHHHQ